MRWLDCGYEKFVKAFEVKLCAQIGSPIFLKVALLIRPLFSILKFLRETEKGVLRMKIMSRQVIKTNGKRTR